MSQDAAVEQERDLTRYARCQKQPRDEYTRLYLGTQRAPARPDEAGALCVVELLFGGRAVFYRIENDPGHRRVVIFRDGAG